MNMTIRFIIALALTLISTTARSELTYAKYNALVSNLNQTEAVTSFIEENNYLSDRLLKKWLGYLSVSWMM